MFLFSFFLYVCFWVYACVCMQRPEDMPNLMKLELQECALPAMRAGIQTEEHDRASRAFNTEFSFRSQMK